jgi:hypothetical protein
VRTFFLTKLLKQGYDELPTIVSISSIIKAASDGVTAKTRAVEVVSFQLGADPMGVGNEAPD